MYELRENGFLKKTSQRSFGGPRLKRYKRIAHNGYTRMNALERFVAASLLPTGRLATR
jgi:hypothetical protein